MIKPPRPKRNSPEIWCGIIPGIFGYGFMVFEANESEVKKTLRKHYLEWKKEFNNPFTNVLSFNQAFEDFGGRIEKVEFGKLYYDNLAS